MGGRWGRRRGGRGWSAEGARRGRVGAPSARLVLTRGRAQPIMRAGGYLLSMKAKVEELRSRGLAEVTAAADRAALDAVRVKYLGKKGLLTDLLKGLAKLPPEERPVVGKLANGVKTVLADAVAARRDELAGAAAAAEAIDVTIPGIAPALGHPHPLIETQVRLEQVFESLGFEVVEGPEVEDEYHNFEALNTPPDHPARDEHDSFYLGPMLLLRTHTSPVQIRVMEGRQPPIKVVATGRCFRRDEADATHLPVFHQIEGLLVDEGINFRHLRGILDVIAETFGGEGAVARVRPDFFPFTEPSAEFAISCFVCGGRGCRVCTEGFIELGGCGMVDPAVFESVGYDPERYTGFAFGFGIERIAMLRYGITDIRQLYDNDMRFLAQF